MNKNSIRVKRLRKTFATFGSSTFPLLRQLVVTGKFRPRTLSLCWWRKKKYFSRSYHVPLYYPCNMHMRNKLMDIFTPPQRWHSNLSRIPSSTIMVRISSDENRSGYLSWLIDFFRRSNHRRLVSAAGKYWRRGGVAWHPWHSGTGGVYGDEGPIHAVSGNSTLSRSYGVFLK